MSRKKEERLGCGSQTPAKHPSPTQAPQDNPEAADSLSVPLVKHEHHTGCMQGDTLSDRGAIERVHNAANRHSMLQEELCHPKPGKQPPHPNAEDCAETQVCLPGAGKHPG